MKTRTLMSGIVGIVAAGLLAGCQPAVDTGERAMREKELKLKTEELALQKKALELQEQELNQARENRAQMQELMQRSIAQGSPASAMTAAMAPEMLATPSPFPVPGQSSMTLPVEQQAELQKLMEQQQKLMQQLQAGEGPVAGGMPGNPYQAPPPPASGPSYENTQSSDMKTLMEDLNRRSGKR